MPVEIRELIIRATIGSSEYQELSSGLGGVERNLQQEQEEIIQGCVEQVLEILKDREER